MRYDWTDLVTVLGKVIVKPDRSFSFLSYLIRGDRNVLIDTVPERAAPQFMEDLTSCLPLEQLDALILNHAEEDHSGALSHLLAQRPDLPLYCTPACRDRLRARFPEAQFRPVHAGAYLSLGTLQFHFIHTPGLHWDDNMTTYLENAHTLFSGDLFGQSLGTEPPLDGPLSTEAILEGARSYFEQVFSASAPEERAVLFGLAAPELEYVAPGHGVILHETLDDVLELYETLCI